MPFFCFNFGNSEIGQQLGRKAEIKEKIEGNLEMLIHPPPSPLRPKSNQDLPSATIRMAPSKGGTCPFWAILGIIMKQSPPFLISRFCKDFLVTSDKQQAWSVDEKSSKKWKRIVLRAYYPETVF